MPTKDNTIIFSSGFIADGYPFKPSIDDLIYGGVAPNSFDVDLGAEEVDKEVDLGGWGTIQRIILVAKSGLLYVKLDNTEEKTPVQSLFMVSHQPTKLVIDNDAESAGLMEVTIIGKTV
jgi:hypothetical protein